MKALSGTGIAICLVSGFLVLALLAELYYLLCLKKKKSTSSKRRRRILHHQQEQEQEQKEEEIASATSPAKELLYLFCWKKPSSLSSSATTTALNPCEIYCSSRADNNASERSEDLHFIQLGEEETGIDAELMRLHSLSGPPRFLFTIKEETKEDLLEPEDGRSRKTSISRSGTGRSLSDLLATTTETPYLTPISSPPFFTNPCNSSRGLLNPLFESFKNDNNELSRMRSSSSSSSSLSSPPPKFKFLRDAEEKLYRKILTEEALRVHRSSGGSPTASPPPMTTTTRGQEDHEDGPFITIIISKGQGQQQQHPTPSQVNPLPSPPPPSITSTSTGTSTRPAAEQGKPVTYFGTDV